MQYTVNTHVMVAFSQRIATLPADHQDTPSVSLQLLLQQKGKRTLTVALGVPEARRVAVEAGIPLLQDRAVHYTCRVRIK